MMVNRSNALKKIWQSWEKSPIGGFLIFVAIYIIYLVVIKFLFFINIFTLIENDFNWQNLLKKLHPYSNLFEIILMIFLISGLIKAKRYFPYLFCIFALFNICTIISWIIFYLYTIYNSNTQYMIGSIVFYSRIIVPSILIIYMLKSKRVKNIFIH